MNNIYIPENDHGITVGYYSTNDIVELLRQYCNNPAIVYFVADMMEE